MMRKIQVNFKFFYFILFNYLKSILLRGKFKKLELIIQENKFKKQHPSIDIFVNNFIKLYSELEVFGLTDRKSDLKILEIGSGQHLMMPILLSICGFKRIVTIDIERMANRIFITKCLSEILEHHKLLEFLSSKNVYLSKILLDNFNFKNVDFILNNFPNLTYIDNIFLNDVNDVNRLINKFGSFDIVISNDVFEHINEKILNKIFLNLVLLESEECIHAHIIDTSDHFHHYFSGIHPKNFLKYSDFQWKLISSNKYIYQNRLQKKWYQNFFENLGYLILKNEAITSHDFKMNINLLNISVEDFCAKRILCVFKKYSYKNDL
jgi:hypothetical protein